jgi:N,N'-diacetyllegionaminate synthase
MSVFVIAEAGSCHDGDLGKAERLVRAAAAAGASAVKFQFWSDPDRLADRRRVPERYREIYRRYRMPVGWLYVLSELCQSQGIEFMASTYLPEDVALVAPFVRRFKVSSFEALDLEFIDRNETSEKPVIVSVGMANQQEAWTVRRRLRRQDAMLACVSAYPAPLEAMNLAMLHPVDAAYMPSPYDGLSDHSRDVRLGGWAVAAGARIIEAHLRLDNTDPENPDFATAFTPAEFAEYVQNIRFAELALGAGEKRLQDCERPMAEYRVRG